MRSCNIKSTKAEKGSKRRRICRCGAGVEIHPGKCDTPGFALRTEPQIIQDPRGFSRLELKRTNKRILQTSAYMMQSWRANCDLQILLYNSDPDNPDLDDIAAVTDYVVTYACKGNESIHSEKERLKSYIASMSDNERSEMATATLAKKVLNRSLKTRMISKQEATVQLDGLDLWTCSDSIETVSITPSYKVSTHLPYEGKGSIYSRYATRMKKKIPPNSPSDYAERLRQMSLHEYFHFIRNYSRSTGKFIIPHYIGGKCIPTWPITYEFARYDIIII
jgi:hypothetical protein